MPCARFAMFQALLLPGWLLPGAMAAPLPPAEAGAPRSLAAPSAAATEEMPLRMGQAYVRAIQEALRRRGYAPGPVDGKAGPRTREAIRAYQRDAGLQTTGEPTQELLDRLKFARAGEERVAQAPAVVQDPPELVAAIQEELHRLGYAPGPVDGIAGPLTRSAIEAFQRDIGLPVTGEAGRELLAELRTRGEQDRDGQPEDRQ